MEEPLFESSPLDRQMDKAKRLVRMIARAFYSTEEIIIIDALAVYHTALNVDEFKTIFSGTGRGQKEIMKHLATLKEGWLVSAYARQEMKIHSQKQTAVEYWYIDYPRAIDATKYKIVVLQERCAQQDKPTTEKKEFVCPQCNSEWTALEAMDHPDPENRGSGFLCNRCNHLLDQRAVKTDKDSDDNSKLARFNKIMQPFMDLLREIDEEPFPEITGEAAYHERKPMPKPASADPLDTKEETIHIRPADVVGQQPVFEDVEFEMTTEQESNAAARASEAEQRKHIADQNKLPAWHTESTILVNPNKAKEKAAEDDGDAFYPMDESEDRPVAKNVVDDYFSQLEKERAQNRLRRQQEDEDEEHEEYEQDDDEEDVEFEDVQVGPAAETSMEIDSTKVRDFALEALETSNELVGGGGDGDGAEESDEDEYETVI
jgi:transcription initiation factor TFIIE subunit alpha